MRMTHYIIGFFKVSKVMFMLSNYDLELLDIYFLELS